MGKEGVGLDYRGYSINDLAAHASFEEIAYLLIHGKLPTQTELDNYKEKLIGLRRLSAGLKIVLEQLSSDAHPMDVMRTGCSALGATEQENETTDQLHIADWLVASFLSMLPYWHHFHASDRRIEVETEDDTTASHFLHLLHGEPPDELHHRAVDELLAGILFRNASARAVSPVICLNSSHGRKPRGYDAGLVVQRDLAYVTRIVEEVQNELSTGV